MNTAEHFAGWRLVHAVAVLSFVCPADGCFWCLFQQNTRNNQQQDKQISRTSKLSACSMLFGVLEQLPWQ